MSALLSIICAVGMTSGSTAMVLEKSYEKYAVGIVDTPSSTHAVSTAAECGAICARKLVCSAFSIQNGVASGGDSDRGFECRIALGDFNWTDATGAELYMEDIGPLKDYTLTRDGRFYKFFLGNSSQSPASHRQKCHDDGGNLVVQYPKYRRNQMVMYTNYTYFFLTGMTLTTNVSTVLTGPGRWVTDDGYVFMTNDGNVDPDQSWTNGEVAGQYWGRGAIIQDNRNMGWYFYMVTESKFPNTFCRRDNIYRKIPKAGPNSKKYYKMHYDKANADDAAQVCASEGGTLASANKQEDWDAIEGYRISTDSFPKGRWQDGFLVGGKAVVNRTASPLWILPDGTTFLTNTTDPSQRWYSGEPNDGISGSRILNLIYMPGGGLGDVFSTDTAKFLCEILVN